MLTSFTLLTKFSFVNPYIIFCMFISIVTYCNTILQLYCVVVRPFSIKTHCTKRSESWRGSKTQVLILWKTLYFKYFIQPNDVQMSAVPLTWYWTHRDYGWGRCDTRRVHVPQHCYVNMSPGFWALGLTFSKVTPTCYAVSSLSSQQLQEVVMWHGGRHCEQRGRAQVFVGCFVIFVQ